jgi:molybdopterin molybdotransferase
VSTFVTFELFVRPVLRRLAGRPDWDLLRPTDIGVLEDPVSTSPGRRAFLRVAAVRDQPGGAPGRDATGRARVRLAGGQGSHVLTALAAADALAIVPESVDALPAGAPVELWWLDRP